VSTVADRSEQPLAEHLLLIFPGPLHDPGAELGGILACHSQRHRGTVIVTGPHVGVQRFGSFDVITIRHTGRAKVRVFSELLALGRRLTGDHRLRGDPFDAVVTYDPLRSGIVGYVVARESGIPLIVQVNGDYTAFANYADIRNPIVRLLKRWIFIRIERFVLRRADGIKLLFDDQIAPFRSALRDPVIRVFPNYVNLTGFRDLGESPELLFVGHPFYLKGVDVLIDAFKRVSDGFPDWRLKILGWFPDRAPLDAAIGGHPRIVLHPPVYRSEMPEHIGRCGIFVLPSRSEAMGRVLLEAMASAKPRIASRVGGIPTVIRDGEDGLLCPPDDPVRLAAALRSLMGDATLRKRLGENGARRAQDEFSPQAYADRIQEFYDSVVRAVSTSRNEQVGPRRASLTW
jgi:glycosyltransferase involved in cell wall biosynthesis